MSLLRLLTAGKSLIGVQNAAGRYRMTDPKAMPKFGEGRNPFQVKTRKGQKSEDRSQTSDVSGSITEKVENAVEPVAVRIPQPASVSPVAGKASPTRGWISKLGSLKSMLRRDVRRSSRPAKELRPVQGELSLESVKVVRNDLSESDLEVVPLRSGAVTRIDPHPKKASFQAGLVLSEANGG